MHNSSVTCVALLEDHKHRLFYVCDTSIWPLLKSFIISYSPLAVTLAGKKC